MVRELCIVAISTGVLQEFLSRVVVHKEPKPEGEIWPCSPFQVAVQAIFDNELSETPTAPCGESEKNRALPLCGPSLIIFIAGSAIARPFRRLLRVAGLLNSVPPES